MKTGIKQRLAEAIPIRYWEQDYEDVRCISRRNCRNLQDLSRLGLAMLIRATQLNNGIVPLPEQIRIQRLLTHRAKRDANASRTQNR